jgi:hypothetical protein
MRYHIAYPQVFKHDGRIYMIPDTHHPLSLYEAADFPLIWRYKNTLLSQRLIDPTITFYNNMHWIIGQVQKSGFSYLHVYYANSPLGPFRPTRNNCGMNTPVGISKEMSCVDINLNESKGAHKRGDQFGIETGIRNGGPIFSYNNSLFRVVQQQFCRLCYGNTLDAYKITTLSVFDKYSEVLQEQFRDNIRSKSNIETWNSKRTHHMSIKEINYSKDKLHSLFVAVFDGNDIPDYYE